MTTRKRVGALFICAGVLVGLLGAVTVAPTIRKAQVPTLTLQQTQQQTLERTAPDTVQSTPSISLTIAGLYTRKEIPLAKDATVLNMLQTLTASDPSLALTTKEYTGLGTLVVSMHGLKNGTNGNYWQYRVNGVMPQVGAGAYALKAGDSVEWFFGPSQQ